MKDIYPLQCARAWRSYLGGAMIGAFFGEDGVRDGHYPEEWIASVVPALTPSAGGGKIGKSIMISAGRNRHRSEERQQMGSTS